jgi:hypothetical protein
MKYAEIFRHRIPAAAEDSLFGPEAQPIADTLLT